MYRSCIFCRSRLGSNRVVEHLATGRALAFDASKGRLWVVCPRCVGWNLVPIQERWEAVEECERLFQRVSRRYSGNDIGLAIARDGTRLIRVGKPTDHEFAAWRYETRLRRRRRLSQLRTFVGASCLAGGVTLWGALSVASASIVVTVWLGGVLAFSIPRNRDSLFTQVPSADTTVPVLRRDLEYVRLTRKGGTRWLALSVWQKGVSNSDVPLALGLVLPHINRRGGAPDEVAAAVRIIRAAGGSEGFIERGFPWGIPVSGLPPHERLAIEMAAHEEMEAAALRGELRGLEIAWRTAEELAGISDSLLTPDISVVRRMRRDLTPIGESI